MNYLALLLGSYLALANHSHLPINNINDTEWNQFKLTYGKSYDDFQVDRMRRVIYAANKQKIRHFNEKFSREAGFSLGINGLADLGHLDMARMNGLRLPANGELPRNSPEAEAFVQAILADDSIEVPESLDWRLVEGRVTRIKNQGDCGSCWAFATTGALEGQERPRRAVNSSKSNGGLVELSQQNLIDCVTTDEGCYGGLPSDAFDYISKEGGVDDEHSYPYEGKMGKCRFRKDKVAMRDSGSALLKQGHEGQLKEVVAKMGPVAVGLDATSLMQLYRTGIFTDSSCNNSPGSLNHAVLVVGYGTDPKEGDFWIVKNSWGLDWGEDGYMRMARNRGNMCGIATLATVPTF